MKSKILPRNLTARADRIVFGNPSVSRPESGTDVCTPGLEIDLRTLEERFFPGFVWDFERSDGAILVDMAPEVQGLKREECFVPARPVYLLALAGKSNASDTEPTFFGLNGPGGRSAWRRVRDLAKGRVAILIGPKDGPVKDLNRAKTFSKLAQALNDGKPQIERPPNGPFDYAVLAADRTGYLDETGAIIDIYEPGELTKGLCAPWQFDFRDCGCNYWAAGKPDMLVNPDPHKEGKYRNFSRNRKTNADAPDVTGYSARKKQIYTNAEMVAGGWKDLPPVIDDKEQDVRQPPYVAPVEGLFNEEQIGAELCYLATVEHALVVEYLYAAYSVNPESPEGRSASRVIVSIAIDEMRHLLWVNEVLQILGYYPSIGRASVLGADPELAVGCCKRAPVPFLEDGSRHAERARLASKPGEAPRRSKYLHMESKLCHLSIKCLDYFIDVERNSRTLNGLYSHLSSSIAVNIKDPGIQARALPILRLIIEEGEDHFERLVQVQKTLAPLPANSWLHKLKIPPTGSQNADYKETEAHYHLLLHVISTAFHLDNGGPALLQMAKEIMTDLDEHIRVLARQGIAFDWPLPDWAGGDDTAETAAERFETYGSRIANPSQRLVRVLAESKSAIARSWQSGEIRRKSCSFCEYRDAKKREC